MSAVTVKVVRDLLEANQRIAEQNKKRFAEAGVTVINLMSAPGAGKTTLLEQTVRALKNTMQIAVVEGDIQTSLDAERIQKVGAKTVQINTSGACHLDANMVAAAVAELPLNETDLMVVENVGNLVCPAEFDVGEQHKVMLLSLAEGDDKPAKYPLMFRESTVLLINKIDLAPHVDARPERVEENARKINPDLTVFHVSCRDGTGMDAWYEWLNKTCNK